VKWVMSWGCWGHVCNDGGPTIMWSSGFFNDSGRVELHGRVIVTPQVVNPHFK
jgi:hypothetical protein